MFSHLIHCDWSKDPKKQWMARAERTSTGWLVHQPERVPAPGVFLDQHLFAGHSVLAGFDFPIGLPESYGKKTGYNSFLEALPAFGQGEWKDFFRVATHAGEISLHRPFYPFSSKKGSERDHLVKALGCQEFGNLLRVCERATSSRKDACPIFWTLGGNQVGKAALHGWENIIQLAVARGAALWPFAGPLAQLAQSSRTVLCETYPAEAYGHIGFRFASGQSKRRQDHRLLAVPAINHFAAAHALTLTREAQHVVNDGFGPSKYGEDPFDTFIGLLSMITVADGKRPEGHRGHCAWEGWIFGQQAENC